MSQRHVRTSWIDQFLLREDVTNPFVQVITAAQQIARVAEDRVGLSREQYDAAGTARYQARLLEDLTRTLDDDVSAHAQRADQALASELEPVTRGRELTSALSGSIRATAMLIDTCHALLVLAEDLVPIRRPSSRLALMAAVEAVRSAASAAHLTVLVNLPRITDVALYDELASGLQSFDVTLAQANWLSSTLRSEVALGQALPVQRPHQVH